MNKFFNKIVEINDHNFNLFVYLIFALLIVDTLTNNFLSSVGINKIALLTFLGISATIKVYFRIKDRVIISSKTIKNISLRRGIIILSRIGKKIVGGKKINLIITLIIIGIIFLYQKSTQQVIAYLTQAGVANYIIYGILMTLYILVAYIELYEENKRLAKN